MSFTMGLHSWKKTVSAAEKCTTECSEHVTFAMTVFQNAKSLCEKVSHAVISLRLQQSSLNLKGKHVSVSVSQISQVPVWADVCTHCLSDSNSTVKFHALHVMCTKSYIYSIYIYTYYITMYIVHSYVDSSRLTGNIRLVKAKYQWMSSTLVQFHWSPYQIQGNRRFKWAFVSPAEVKYLMIGQVIPVCRVEFSSTTKAGKKVVLQGTRSLWWGRCWLKSEWLI